MEAGLDMNWINNFAQLRYYEELAGLIIFGMIFAGYLIYLGILCLSNLFKSRRKNSARFLNRTLLLCIPSGWNSCLGENQQIEMVNHPLPSVSQQAVINSHSTEVIDLD